MSSQEHLFGVKNIFRYLKHTNSLGITYCVYSARNNLNKLDTFSDSDQAGCPHSRSSLSGYVLMMNGGHIQWNK